MLQAMKFLNTFNVQAVQRIAATIIPLSFVVGCGSSANLKDIPYPVPIDPVEPFVTPIKQKPIPAYEECGLKASV